MYNKICCYMVSFVLMALFFGVLATPLSATPISDANAPSQTNRLHRELISVKYENATKVVEAFNTQNTLEKGSLKVDTRTNTLIANLTEENLEKLHQLVTKMDIPVARVQLEARIIAVDSNYIATLKEQIKSSNLDLALNTMQKQGKGEVISQPKVTTNNKEEARMMKGVELCYCPADTPRPPKPQYTFELKIIPEIISDQQVKLDIQITIIDALDNTQQKLDTITKTVDNNQLLLLDEIGELNVVISDKNQQLIIFITPKILDTASFKQK